MIKLNIEFSRDSWTRLDVLEINIIIGKMWLKIFVEKSYQYIYDGMLELQGSGFLIQLMSNDVIAIYFRLVYISVSQILRWNITKKYMIGF